jgi:hypothetical protein
MQGGGNFHGNAIAVFFVTAKMALQFDVDILPPKYFRQPLHGFERGSRAAFT